MTLSETKPLKVIIGTSACLLGRNVRYDHKDKIDSYITGVLAQHFDLLPICPETEAGMGLPREPVHLVGRPASPKMIGNTSGADQTGRMNLFLEGRIPELAQGSLCGCILKSGSPSCGLQKIPVITGGKKRRVGTGLFARALTEVLPQLPVVDEVKLRDPARRRNFISRVLGYAQLRQLFRGRPTRANIQKFHRHQENRIRAHSPRHWQQLAKLFAAIDKYSPSEFRQRYGRIFLEALSFRSTATKNIAVMQRIIRTYSNRLSEVEATSLHNTIERYRQGLVPLAAPLTLVGYLQGLHVPESNGHDAYLFPDPREAVML